MDWPLDPVHRAVHLSLECYLMIGASWPGDLMSCIPCVLIRCVVKVFCTITNFHYIMQWVFMCQNAQCILQWKVTLVSRCRPAQCILQWNVTLVSRCSPAGVVLQVQFPANYFPPSSPPLLPISSSLSVWGESGAKLQWKVMLVSRCLLAGVAGVA